MSIDHRAIIENPELLKWHSTVHPLAVLIGDVHLAKGSVVMPMAVVGKPTVGRAVLARSPDSTDAPTVIGEDTTIDCHAVVYGGVQIGRRCLVGTHASIREGAVIGSGCVIGHHADVSHDCVLSDGVRVMNHTILIGGTVVGEGAFIGPGVTMANDADMDGIVAGKWSDRRFDPPTIGARAFIGCGAVLLSGVHIGADARVCAGALVTKDVMAGDTVLGMPARSKVVVARFAEIARFEQEHHPV